MRGFRTTPCSAKYGCQDRQHPYELGVRLARRTHCLRKMAAFVLAALPRDRHHDRATADTAAIDVDAVAIPVRRVLRERTVLTVRASQCRWPFGGHSGSTLN